jgi:hypothetical protein
MIEKIKYLNINLAIIIRSNFSQEGISFFSDQSDSQQLGYMNRKAGYSILPHKHNLIPRNVHFTQEVLFIKSGKLRVDFYDNEKKYIFSKILFKGDVILLSDGGHGFFMIEDSEIIEVKQGPYCGEMDKTRFDKISDNQLNIL